MDFTTILGLVIAVVAIVLSIGLGDIGLFWDLPSVGIVVGGTIAALITCYPMGILKSVPKHILTAVKGRQHDPMEYIDTIVEFAMIARKSGLLALEEKANALEDPFLKQGLFLIVDAIDSDKVKELLEGDLNYLEVRHDDGAGFWDKGAAFAPAFGMVGTLIGLIKMLAALNFSDSGGAAAIGMGMSLALVTTFYGVLLANLVFTPISSKLRLRHAEETLCKEIIIEGVLSIQSGENPKFIREKLVSFLAQKMREQGDESGSDGEDGEGKKTKKPRKEKAPKKGKG